MRQSQYAKLVTVTSSAAAAPLAPSLLVVGNEASTGRPSLSWLHLFPGTVRFFRIYRDTCCSVANRYDATASNGLSWVDPKPGTVNHRYWVTAVGPSLSESGPSNAFDWLAP